MGNGSQRGLSSGRFNSRGGETISTSGGRVSWNGRASHTFTVLSQLPVTTREPSALNDADFT
jgi:hypothetical protein